MLPRGESGEAHSLRSWHTSDAVDLACALILLGFLAWSLVGEAVRIGALSPASLDDYAILHTSSREVLARGDYAWQLEPAGRVVVFAYGPGAVLVHVALGALGLRVGGLVWMVAMAASAIACVVWLLDLAGWRDRPLRWLVVLLAVVPLRFFVQFDLHFLNGNVIVLALAIAALARTIGAGGGDGAPRKGAAAARRDAAAAGLLLAASLVLKPLALAWLPWLLVLRRADVLAWCAAGLALLHAVLPALVLGPAEAWALLASWLETVARVSSLDFVPRIAAHDVSLPSALAGLLGADASRAPTRALQLGWLALVAWSIWPRRREGPAPRDCAPLPGPSRERLREAGVLLLAPLPLTTLLQPHQGVVFLPLVLVLAGEALEADCRPRRRAVLAALAGWLFLSSSYAPDDGPRGLAIFASAVLVVLAAATSGSAPASGRAVRRGAR